MRKLYFVVAFLIFAISVNAEKINEDRARDIAEHFLNKTGKTSKMKASKKNLALAITSTGYYAFNNGNNAGYVIVAADDKATEEVLGYADEGQLNTNDMPDNLKWWLEEYDRQAQYANATKTESQGTVRKVERADIAPMITTKWNQDAPYYDQCPTYNGAKCYTGCVATAIAQIMYYHKWPEQGTGSYSYQWNRTTLSADFSQSTYKWNAMTNTYNDNSSAESKEAVAKLMSDVGIACNMRYSTTSSGTLSIYAAQALSKFFGYDKGIRILSRDYFTTTEWSDILYSELAASRPIYYAGATLSREGHAFVFDGYHDGYYHINWGWGGMSNGYFLLSAFTPNVQGIGGSTSGFNFAQEAIVGIQKATDDSEYTPVMSCIDGFSTNISTGTHSSNVYFGKGFLYSGTVKKALNLGIKVTDTENNVSYIAGKSTVSFEYGQYANTYSVNMSGFPNTDGTYTITPAIRDEQSGKWYDVNVGNGEGLYVNATVKGDAINFTKMDEEPLSEKASKVSIKSKLYVGKNSTGKATFTAVGADCYDLVRFGFIKKGSDNLDINENHSEYLIVDLEANTSKDYDFRFESPSEVGDYYFVIVNSNDEIISDSIPVTVTEAPTGTANLSVAKRLYVPNTNSVSMDNIEFSANIKCKSGYFDGQIYAVFFEGDETSSGKMLLSDYISIAQGETDTVHFAGTFNGIKPATAYTVLLAYRNENGSLVALGSEGFQYNSTSFTTEDPSGIITTDTEDGTPHDIDIYTLDGSLVERQRGLKVDLSHLSKGVYIVKTAKEARRIVVTK